MALRDAVKSDDSAYARWHKLFSLMSDTAQLGNGRFVKVASTKLSWLGIDSYVYVPTLVQLTLTLWFRQAGTSEVGWWSRDCQLVSDYLF